LLRDAQGSPWVDFVGGVRDKVVALCDVAAAHQTTFVRDTATVTVRSTSAQDKRV
jgi:hypothetical protein